MVQPDVNYDPALMIGPSFDFSVSWSQSQEELLSNIFRFGYLGRRLSVECHERN